MQWQQELKRRQKTLDPSSHSNRTLCWGLLTEELPLARQLGLEEELRTLCWEAAGKFADPRMLRCGMRYYKAGTS